MWFPNEKMDINKFYLVHLPSRASYLARFGFSSAPASMYTGDEPAPLPKDKIGSIAEMEQYDAMMQREELFKANEKSDET